MSSERVRELINLLRAPVSDLTSLLSTLAGPLDRLGLLPPVFRKHNTSPLPPDVRITSRHILTLQQVILEHVVPVWQDALADEGVILLLEQYFCPDLFYFASAAAGEVSSFAYSSLLSVPLTEYSVHLLARLAREYPIDRLHSAVFTGGAKSELAWEDVIGSLVSVPTKVANALGGKHNALKAIPPALEHGTYFETLSARCEILMFSLSSRKHAKNSMGSMTSLLTRLVNLGLFPAAPPTSRSQPSFFGATLSIIRARFRGPNAQEYSDFWSNVISSLTSTFTLRAILTSFFASLSTIPSGLDHTPLQRVLIKQEAMLLRRLVGRLNVDNDELWECASALFLSRDWDVGRGRIFVCWVAGYDEDQMNEVALDAFLTKVVDVWASPEHIKHSLLNRHRYMTSLLLIVVSYLPRSSPQHANLALSPTFISGVGKYISHLDNAVRRCGMLAAEIVAQNAGKKLDFGDWDGDDDAGKPWARELRRLIGTRDVDAIISEDEPDIGIEEISTAEAISPGSKNPRPVVSESRGDDDDDDDSLTGYASPTSSRSASPTPSELDEIEKDPTIIVGVKKVPRPVYLAQLGEMVRSTGGVKQNDANQEAEKIEMALNCAEELIRKKKDYGTELEENTVNLAYGLVGLQNNYELADFDVKRQWAVNALVACCPRKASPCLIEEFFKNQYSTNQRFAMLNALAIGARELASLPFPSSATSPLSSDRTSFPSKVLPSGQHQKYLAASNQTDTVQRMLEGISLAAIKSGNGPSPDEAPDLVRERRLRIRQPAKVTEIARAPSSIVKPHHPTGGGGGVAFMEVAAEFFIAPLINRFWLFLRDEQTREERTRYNESLYQYRGAGTGLILSPYVLAHFLATLAVLVHAARNAPEWLAIIAPDALELAVTLGTRPVSRQDGDQEGDHGPGLSEGGKEASVLTAALELALVILDGCLELDGGRSIGLDHTALLLGAGEWAGGVFALLEKGLLVPGGGGAQETRLKSAAAGVLLKVDALTSKWRRSMVSIAGI